MTTDTSKTEVGSVFISNYPQYSQWKGEWVEEVASTMNAPPADVPLGLYLHIPFCRKRCKFCYFKVYIDRRADDIERYMAGLSKEIELCSQLPVVGERPFRFVYFGGGTPSFLSVRQLNSLAERLRTHIAWDQAEEVTFECEPGTLSQPKVQAIRELGVTRISLGIENFSDTILEVNGRAHLSKEVHKAWDWITAAGFPNVNIDLISGMNGETWDNWRDCVRRTIELSPDSVTIYQMELPFNTVISHDILEGKESPIAGWELKRAWHDYAINELSAVGYHIDSAYTLVKDPSRVKFTYRDSLWHGADMLGTGVASIGHISGVHYQNQPKWEDYLSALESGQLPLERGMRATPHQRLIREMILLLKRGWLDAGYFHEKFSVNILEAWQEVWQQYVAEAMLTIDGDRIELTRKGLLQVDGLLPLFFETQHQGVRYT